MWPSGSPLSVDSSNLLSIVPDSEKPTSPSAAHGSLQGSTIVVAEDDRITRELLAGMLRKHGFSDAELTLLFRTNPAKILGLPVTG